MALKDDEKDAKMSKLSKLWAVLRIIMCLTSGSVALADVAFFVLGNEWAAGYILLRLSPYNSLVLTRVQCLNRIAKFSTRQTTQQYAHHLLRSMRKLAESCLRD